MQRIPFHDLPDFSALFCEYVNGNPGVAKYFNGDPHSLEDTGAQIERVQQRYYPRDAVADILKAQNAEWRAGKKTLQNIELLRDPKTVAVVTGQQVSLFGGPLYTIYKTITAIKLCKELRKWHRGANYVPIFWLETEDHDVAEANHTSVLDAAGAPVTLTYQSQAPVDENAPRDSVGHLCFDAGISTLTDQLEKTLASTEFTPAVLKLVRKCYRPGVDFGNAFGSLMQALFNDEGLILANPLDPALKRLLAPVFRREIETSPRVSEAIISTTAQLEESFHAQVKARTINIFLRWKNGRYGIDPRREHGDYWLKGTRQYFTRDELMALLEKEPERFSPNVVLRPICQDFLFPTVMYVGGPGEIAYFAQFKGAYDAFEIPMPIVYPRASVTLLELKFAAQLNRLSLGLGEYLHSPEDALKKLVQSQSAVNLDVMFAKSRDDINTAYEGLRDSVANIDKTLVGALTNSRDKSLQAMDVLAKKVIDAAVRSNETATRQMEKLKAGVYPDETMQERSLSMLYYINKYGMDFLSTVSDRISLDTFEHQAITIDGAAKREGNVQESLF